MQPDRARVETERELRNLEIRIRNLYRDIPDLAPAEGYPLPQLPSGFNTLDEVIDWIATRGVDALKLINESLTRVYSINSPDSQTIERRKMNLEAYRERVERDVVNPATKRLDKVANKYLNMVLLVARTETTRVENFARLHALEIAGRRRKRWNAVIDNRSRPDHVAMDGEIRPLRELFSNGLIYPGDPDGEAKDVCNCRCWISAD